MIFREYPYVYNDTIVHPSPLTEYDAIFKGQQTFLSEENYLISYFFNHITLVKAEVIFFIGMLIILFFNLFYTKFTIFNNKIPQTTSICGALLLNSLIYFILLYPTGSKLLF